MPSNFSTKLDACLAKVDSIIADAEEKRYMVTYTGPKGEDRYVYTRATSKGEAISVVKGRAASGSKGFAAHED